MIPRYPKSLSVSRYLCDFALGVRPLQLGIRHASDTYFEGALLIALFSFVNSSAMAKFLLRGEVIE